jgi:hypothetical protein
MKNFLMLSTMAVALSAVEGWTQPTPGTPSPSFTPANPRYGVQSAPAELSRFSLDFPGGTPKALVADIQKALAKPLNAIVPDEYADTKIPPLKMSNVNVEQLFSALEQASRKTEAYESASYYGGGQFGGYRSIQQVTTSYGFRQGPGPLTDDTVWYFHAEKPPMPTLGGTSGSRTVRFYSLSPYLKLQHEGRHLTVDDITTAIETGWKMLGENAPPKISFHKDTNLLIAVGQPDKLEMIDAVLKALAPDTASAAPDKVAAPKPGEPPRSAEPQKTGSE